MKTILVDAANTFVVDGQVNQEMFKLLEIYPNKKIILTNANDEQLITFGLVNLPYEIFTLKHNPDKIDPKYFETMLESLKLNREDVIYFEHNNEAVKSAESIGIKSYQYNPQAKDLDKLKSFIEGSI
jgi:HAD superfamily hydrolase (TIGR01509 family)